MPSLELLNSIILAATENGGMGDDFFENKTRHTLPIVDMPLICHLMNTIDLEKRIKNKYIIIGEKLEDFEKLKPCEVTYKSIFSDRIGKDVHLFGQDPLTKIGTFEAVKDFLYINNNENIFPLLVIYGDTIVEEEFLKYMIDSFFDEKDESKIIWGFIKHDEEKGDIVIKPIDLSARFRTISEEDIVNIYEYQVKKYDSFSLVHDTGIMIISREAWINIIKLIASFHRPSSLGMFSFTNILKQAFIIKNTNIECISDLRITFKGIVAHEGSWYGVNYPWGMLQLNKIKLLDMTKEAKWDSTDIKFLYVFSPRLGFQKFPSEIN